MCIHTRGSGPKRFAKFGWHKRTFCGKIEEKAVSQIKSGRLYISFIILCEAIVFIAS